MITRGACHAVRCRLLLLSGVVLILAGACIRSPAYTLRVSRPGVDSVIADVPVTPETEFTLRYTHSVSLTEVEGLFRITSDGKILPVTTRFRAFGPGLPWTPGTEHVTDTDGRIVYTHDEEARDELLLWVSELTRETVRVGQTTIQLYTPGGQYERVMIRIEGRSR